MKATQIADKRCILDRRQVFFGLPLLAAGAACPHEVFAATASSDDAAPIVTHHRTKTIDGIKIFYREAGPANAPVVLLAARLPDLIAHVSQSDPGARRSLSRDRP